MEQHCQNPLCENEATKVVAVSVDKPSDQQRSLCAVCEEAYSWGVQHGCMMATPKRLWVAAVTHRGDVVHAEALAGKVKAVKALTKYLKTKEGYVGPAELPGICAWLAEHDERLGIVLFCASVDAGEDTRLSAGTHNPNAQRGLAIDPPPQEKGPEPLYRAVYAIDINATNAHQAAERAHEIMIDPQSMRPVLYVLDGENTQTVVDLARESSQALDGSQVDESQTKACRFVQANGARCPQCNSKEIEYGGVELDARCAYQEAYCRSCQARFCAVYQLAGYGLHIGDSFEVHILPGDHTAAGDDDQQTES
jgi:predicted Zn-ribbon and HTH transcriptional regulator